MPGSEVLGRGPSILGIRTVGASDRASVVEAWRPTACDCAGCVCFVGVTGCVFFTGVGTDLGKRVEAVDSMAGWTAAG